MLSLKNVNKYYKSVNNFHALKDITINVNEGEFVAILGESGSGKSTLLNVISGLDEYESGDITINGVSTKDFSKKEWAIYRNNYVGFIFQEYNLVDHLTIAENVELPLLLQGVSPKEARKKALEECKLLGLINHVNKIPNKLSGGQQQRAAIARALITEPKVILADEPTGALDSENAKIILDILKVLSKDHVVILVTHDEDFAIGYADRIITLEDGRIISDTNQNVIASDVTKEINLKRPNMKLSILWKFAKNNLKKRKFRTFFTSLTMSIGLISIFLILFLVNGIRTEVNDFITSIIPKDQYFVKSEINNSFLSDEDYNYIKSRIGNEVSEAYYQYTIIPLTNNEVGSYKDDEMNEVKIYEQKNYSLIGIPTIKENFYSNLKLVGEYPKNNNEVIISSKVAEEIVGIKNIKEKDLNKTLTLLDDFNVERFSSFDDDGVQFKIVGIIYANSNDVFVLNSKLEEVSSNITEDDIALYYQNYNNLHNSSLVDKSILNVFLNTKNQREIDSFADSLASKGLVLKNPENIINSSINNFFDTVLYILLGTAAISLIVAGILVGLMIYISVVERIKEIGILTSIGARGSNIRSMFLFESGFIGFLSSFLAFLISLLIALIINEIFNSTIGRLINSLNIPQLNTFTLMHIDIWSIVIVIAVSILFAMLCGLIPAIMASRLKAVEALRKE